MSDINKWVTLSEKKNRNLNKILNKISFLIKEDEERASNDFDAYFKKYNAFSAKNPEFVDKVNNYSTKKGSSQYESLMRELYQRDIKDNFKYAIDYLVSLYKQGTDTTPELFSLLSSPNFTKVMIQRAKTYVPGINRVDPEDLNDIIVDAIYEKLTSSIDSYNMNEGAPTFLTWLYSANSAVMNAIRRDVKQKTKGDSIDASVNDDDDSPKRGDFLGTSDEKVELDDEQKKLLQDKIKKQREFMDYLGSKNKGQLVYIFKKIYLLDELSKLMNGEEIDSFDAKSTNRYGKWMDLFNNLDELEQGKTDLGSYIKKKALDIIVVPEMAEFFDKAFIESTFKQGKQGRVEGVENKDNFGALLSKAIESKPDLVNIIKYIGGTEENSYFNNSLYDVFGPKYKAFVYKTLVEAQSMTRHAYKQYLTKFGTKWEDLMLKGQVGKYTKIKEKQTAPIDESEDIIKEEDSYLIAWLGSND